MGLKVAMLRNGVEKLDTRRQRTSVWIERNANSVKGRRRL